MTQQHTQFEEEFRDGPQPYQTGYSGPQPDAIYQPNPNNPQPAAYTMNVPGQKLLVHDLATGSTPGVGARLALAIVSLAFTFIMFMVALAAAGTTRIDGAFPLGSVAIFFALIFSVIVIILNLIFNRRR